MVDPLQALEHVARALRLRPDIVAAWVFGSTARGEVAPRDLDLAVLFGRAAEDPLRRALDVQSDLEIAAGLPVDVHDFDGLPVDLQFRVLDEGRLIVDRDPALRVRREVKAMLEYYDFAPYLERIREGSRVRLASGATDG